jgi:hypothetical protein
VAVVSPSRNASRFVGAALPNAASLPGESTVEREATENVIDLVFAVENRVVNLETKLKGVLAALVGNGVKTMDRRFGVVRRATIGHLRAQLCEAAADARRRECRSALRGRTGDARLEAES